MEKFKTLSDFSRSYSEAKWPYVLENKKMAYLSYTPTLFDISEIYGRETAVDWVTSSVCAIWFVKPDADSMFYRQARSWAGVFVSMNRHFKIGELMLFFARCKAGKYQLGYQLDVTRVGLAFEEKFKKERHEELAAYENEENDKRIARLKEEASRGISWKEYCASRNMAGNPANPIESMQFSVKIPETDNEDK